MRYVRKICSLSVALASCLLSSGLAQETKTAATLTDLRQKLAEHVSQSKFAAAMWGVKVVSFDTGRVVFEHNARKLFSPASNTKLYTVALALERFGADYRIKTSLYAPGKPDGTGTVAGDLIVYGRGDPTINARLHGGNIYRALQPLVSALTNASVKRISGDLVGDESYFRGPSFGSGWAWEDLENAYGAEISALTINDNTLQLSVRPGERAGAPCKIALSPTTTVLSLSNRTMTVSKGQKRTIHIHHPPTENAIDVSGQMAVDDPSHIEDVAVHNPARLFVSMFREALVRSGIQIVGTARTMNWLDRQANLMAAAQVVELGSVESATLGEIATETLKPSQNLYADLLLAQVGEKARAARQPSEQTSEALGLAELAKFLAQAGIPRDEVFFEEGSGLSRDNLTTPNATVMLLEFVSRRPYAEIFLQALPVAGVDGTLRDRMKGTEGEGKVRAKTGTLRWTNSLSGHVTTAGGEHLLFCIMLNRFQPPDPGRSARGEVDALAIMLAGFAGRSDEGEPKPR